MTTTLDAAPEVAVDRRSYRLTSIDVLRGLVIVIMAIDHVRDMILAGATQDPMADPNVTVGVFFTRWITHFCAPVFVLLAGVSAGLMASRRSRNDLFRLLLTRGLWLLVVECVLISTSATFSPRGIPQFGGATAIILQVIWVIAAGMIVLSVAQWLGRRACLALGLAIVAGHNLLDPTWPVSAALDQKSWPFWVALHSQASFRVGPFLFIVIYPVLAWIGVMLLGFGLSPIFELPERRRNALLLRGGLAMVVAFVALRSAGFYGDSNGWQLQPGGLVATTLDFLNTTKYPPSLDFVLMTWGPAAIFCAFADRLPARVSGVLTTYGRVPFAFYVPHFYLIHVISIALGLAQGFTLAQMWTLFFFYPQGYGLGLAGVYAVWVVVIVTLYPFCRWVGSVKARRKDWWLSYV
jgi:uncharacterized membrane protein